MQTRKLGLLPAVIILTGSGQGQTLIDLRTQSKSVDFSSASFTKPSKTGAGLPAACGVGETYFRTDAPPGKNYYGCTSQNTWTLLGVGLSNMALRGSACLTVGGGQYVFDVGQTKNVFTASAPASLCITGGTSAELLHVSLAYNNGSPQLVADGAANTYSFSSCGGFGACVVTSTGTWPPDFYIPIATLATTANSQFSQIGSDLTDYRSALSAKVHRSGAGITGTETGTTAVDFNVVASYASGASVPASCTSSQQLFILQDSTNGIYQGFSCVNGKYQPVNFLYGAASNRPVNCAAGQVYLATDTQTLSFSAAAANPCTWLNLAGNGTVTAASGGLSNHQVVLGNGGDDVRTAVSPGSAGQVLTSNGPGADPNWTDAGQGTVTSVCMTGDGVVFNSSVPGSCVTSSGALAPALLTQAANTVLAGPPTGGAATPSFRAPVLADLPGIPGKYLYGSDAAGGAGYAAAVQPRDGLSQDGSHLDAGYDTSVQQFAEDFQGGASSTAGLVGQENLTTGPFHTTACSSAVYQDATGKHIGILRLTGSATSGEGCAIDGGSSKVIGTLDANGPYANGWRMDSVFRLNPSASGNLSNTAFSTGIAGIFRSINSVQGANGIYLSLDTGANLACNVCAVVGSGVCSGNNPNTPGGFVYVAAKGSGYSCIDTGVVAQANTWYHFRAASTILGTVTFSLGQADGALGLTASTSTNVPAISTNLGAAIKTETSSSAAMDLDYLAFKGSGIGR
jgi:hypothetical protein